MLHHVPFFLVHHLSPFCLMHNSVHKSSRPQVLLVAEKSLRDSPIYEAVLFDPPKPVSVITPPRTRWADDHVECLPPCLPTEGKPTKIKGKDQGMKLQTTVNRSLTSSWRKWSAMISLVIPETSFGGWGSQPSDQTVTKLCHNKFMLIPFTKQNHNS